MRRESLKFTKKRIILLLCIFAWMGVIFFMSAQNADESQELSDGIVEEIVEVVSKIITHKPITAQKRDFYSFLVRKAAHMTEYAILAFLCACLATDFSWAYWKGMVSAWGFATLYAMTDEFHQLFSDGRAGQMRDVLIDSSGALIGLLAFFCICGIMHKVAKTRNKFTTSRQGEENSSLSVKEKGY